VVAGHGSTGMPLLRRMVLSWLKVTSRAPGQSTACEQIGVRLASSNRR
jgi:hypothetical protein